MRYWTAHIRADAEPVVLCEGFAWWGALFGPFWLAWRGAWVPAALLLAAWLLLGALAAAPTSIVLGLALAWLTGLLGWDLVRSSLAHRGYLLGQVLSARSSDEALGRLLARRPDLASRFLPARSAR